MSAVYTVGTISVTNGSDIVTGSGTAWVGVIQAGWQIKLPNGEIYWVRQVNSATQLQLENDYTGTSQSNQEYIAGPTGGIARALANKVQDLIGDFQGVVDNAGDGKFADGDLAQPGIRFIADEDTGFRRPSSNTLDVVTGGVQRARFTSGGLLTGSIVTQSATDTTSGRLTKVGDFGLGVPPATNTVSNPGDATNLPSTGFYSFSNNQGGTVPAVFGALFSYRASAARFAQIVISTASPSNQMFFRQELDGVNADWNRLYHNNNILGTVSQSSGVPTGAIIERGSNANGEFVRFADGTQICTVSVSLDFTTSGNFTQNYPASFEGTPRGGAPGIRSGSSAAIANFQSIRAWGSISPNSWNINLSGDGPGGSGADIAVTMNFIGRWV